MAQAVTGNEMTQPRYCHCLCGKIHPAAPGICETENAVTTRRYNTELLGPVDVPLCGPCAAVAQVTS
jgi:hypothetical protein